MVAFRDFRVGGFGRGAPRARGRAAGKRWALVLIALSGLFFSGCAQLGLGNRCGGGCGSGCRLLDPVRRIFSHGRRDVIVTDGCGDAGGMPVETVPGAITTPGPVIGAPPADDPGSLEPAQISPTNPAQGSNSGAKKTLYQTSKPRGGTETSRRSGVSVPTFEPPPSSDRPLDGVAPAADDPLVNLPPVAASVEPAKDPVTPPAQPAASLATQPASPELPPKPAEAAVSVAPGFARFRVVDRQLAGGSLPTDAGWAFLAEKGYKTVIDLREPSEVHPNDVASVAHGGFRYIPIPVTAQTLNAAVVSRFQEEITLAGSRPLYFFDTDGSRASVMWYVRQVAIDKIDPRDAARDAEEVGPRDTKYWLAAESYLESLKPAPAAPAPAAPPAPVTAPPEKERSKPNSAAVPSTTPRFANAKTETPAGPAPRDPSAWKPYAALVVAGLGVPLAYMSRGALSLRPFSRASLPAPARKAPELPDASGD